MLLRYHSLMLAASAAFAAPLGAQSAPPSTDVYLVDIKLSRGALTVGTVFNITHRDGYDNQPSFTPDGLGVLFTSVREDRQADIYLYDVVSRTTRRLTSTPESEYSATVMPGGSSFSVIRVEADSTQRLWAFPLRGSGKPRVLLKDIKPVGYHAWADANSLALFILGQPATLQRADTRTGKATVVAENIGRAMQKIPGRRAVSFVQRVPADSSRMWLKEIDFNTGTVTSLVQTLPGSEYHVWLPDGSFLMAQGTSLYRYDLSVTDGTWSEVASFDDVPQLQRITRLALSPKGDRLAMVGEPAPAPRPK